VSNTLPARDAEYFQELQTQTGWGRTLYSFAQWCDPRPGWLILDAGCGPGILPEIFSKSGCTAIGIDVDPLMFYPAPLHLSVAVADIYRLSFRENTFDLITCSNVLFLLANPARALFELRSKLVRGGKLALLNPSEMLNEQAAQDFATEKQLDGLARSTLLNWAKRAAENHHWTENETKQLYEAAGMTYGGSVLRVGPGFARFSWGLRLDSRMYSGV
jgi:SAM-dependent methyltransferase